MAAPHIPPPNPTLKSMWIDIWSKASIPIIAVIAAGLITWIAMQIWSPNQKPVPPAQFVLLSGQKINMAQLKGKVVIINFWATDCATCVREMPRMISTYNRYKDNGLEFIAVAMKYDPPMYVKNFTETRKLPFKVAMDSDGSAAKAFDDVQLTPTTFLIDKEGRLIKRYIGEPEWNGFYTKIEEAIRKPYIPKKDPKA